MSTTWFDMIPDAYEAMIDWPKRLANEAPFYRELFEEVQARRVLDVACGTGHHASMFHSWGWEVEGADVSAAMIERARSLHGESPGLRWVVRSFAEPVQSPGSFDAAVCAGNSLALAGDAGLAGRAIEQMMRAVRPGGVVVVQVLNLWRLEDGPCLWQKCLRAPIGGHETLIHKGVHRAGGRGFVDLVLTRLDASPPQMYSESVTLLALDDEQLAGMAAGAGAASVAIYGNYRREPYQRAASPDLLMVVRR